VRTDFLAAKIEAFAGRRTSDVHEQPPVRDPAASAEDLALTRRLAAAASLLGKYTPSGGASDSTTTPHVLGPSRGDLVRY
jgi:hypothetical protein